MKYNMKRIQPYILAGGVGSRLYPLSTPEKPKPFLNLVSDDKTLLQQTVQNIHSIRTNIRSDDFISDPFVICHDKHTGLVDSQVSGMIAGILAEIESRNTAFPVLMAAKHCNDDALCLIMPSDHYIGDFEQFALALDAARPYAEFGSIVCFGVKPDHPSTEYGYVHPADGKFYEKPVTHEAELYINQGYLWNAGMFLFRPSVMETEFMRLFPEFMENPRSISIDKAIMEKCDKIRVVPLKSSWSDLGTWQTIYDHLRTRQHSDVVGIGSFTTDHCERCLILNYSNEPVKISNIKNTVIIISENKQSFSLDF